MDDFYERISEELYPDHKTQAIEEFTAERLKSYYVNNPDVMRPAIDALQEGKALLSGQHYAASLIFFVSAIELLLKATLLKPVVYGLVHHEGLADVIVRATLSQSGFDRYEDLLAKLFDRLVKLDVRAVCRDNSSTKLLSECRQLQKIRNNVVHKGAKGNETDARLAHTVSIATYELIVSPMLRNLGLTVGERGVISPTNQSPSTD